MKEKMDIIEISIVCLGIFGFCGLISFWFLNFLELGIVFTVLACCSTFIGIGVDYSKSLKEE